MSEIKPCPFCGVDDWVIDSAGSDPVYPWAVWCGFCHADGPVAKTEIDAIADWNRRAPLTVADCLDVPEIRALVEDLSAEAEEPCAYGDNCPPFGGTRHGQCRACKARESVAPFLAAMKGES